MAAVFFAKEWREVRVHLGAEGRIPIVMMCHHFGVSHRGYVVPLAQWGPSQQKWSKTMSWRRCRCGRFTSAAVARCGRPRVQAALRSGGRGQLEARPGG